jgi:hypothetical protein
MGLAVDGPIPEDVLQRIVREADLRDARLVVMGET